MTPSEFTVLTTSSGSFALGGDSAMPALRRLAAIVYTGRRSHHRSVDAAVTLVMLPVMRATPPTRG